MRPGSGKRLITRVRGQGVDRGLQVLRGCQGIGVGGFGDIAIGLQDILRRRGQRRSVMKAAAAIRPYFKDFIRWFLSVFNNNGSVPGSACSAHDNSVHPESGSTVSTDNPTVPGTTVKFDTGRNHFMKIKVKYKNEQYQ